LPFAATWMGLEGITLSEISQRKKYYMISHVKSKTKQKHKAHRYREHIAGCQRWEVSGV